jgi:DNA-binding transcriptional LysR family regulator
MSTFLAAVDAGSFSAASRKLGVPLATVSRRVSDLEAYLNTKLLIRTSRRLQLTDSGRTYLVACRDVLATVEEAERTAAGEYALPTGDIVVAAPIVFGRLHVLPVIVAFLNAFPEITVRLAQSDRFADFVEDRIDVAVRIGSLSDSNLVATRLGSVRHMVCASPTYLDRRYPVPSHPSDLARHDCITFERLMSPTSWTFRVGMADTSLQIRSRLVVNTAEAAIDAAIAGLGITRVLSYQVADAVRSGTLKVILEAYEPDPSPVHLVYSAQGLVPLKTRVFVEFAKDRLRTMLWRA